MAETGLVLAYVCVLSTIALFSSPLMTVNKVMRTRNAESAAGFISNTLWTLYGVAANEVFVWAPNVVCVLMGLVQILLYVKYNPKKQVGSDDVITVVCVDEAEFSETGKADLLPTTVSSPSFHPLRSPPLASIGSIGH